jgi:hypothetical protein
MSIDVQVTVTSTKWKKVGNPKDWKSKLHQSAAKKHGNMDDHKDIMFKCVKGEFKTGGGRTEAKQNETRFRDTEILSNCYLHKLHQPLPEEQQVSDIQLDLGGLRD